jgi:hypothetical protein
MDQSLILKEKLEKKKLRNAQYYAANKDKSKKYRADNIDRIKALERKRHAENREARNQHVKEYALRIAERKRAEKELYYEQHPEERPTKCRQKNNEPKSPEEIRERNRLYMAQYYKKNGERLCQQAKDRRMKKKTQQAEAEASQEKIQEDLENLEGEVKTY